MAVKLHINAITTEIRRAAAADEEYAKRLAVCCRNVVSTELNWISSPSSSPIQENVQLRCRIIKTSHVEEI